MGKVEDRLTELGIVLPEPPRAVGTYLPVRRSGDLLYLSGQVAMGFPADIPVTGKVGMDITLEQAQECARLTGLNLLATLRAELGDLDRVCCIVKLFGMVNCAPDFNRTPEVINGCSALLIDVFGDAGCHARSAIGVAELPYGYSVEIEMIAEVR
jgi:enamine deaminase RidA (YjgF/YER057c/UK114 family)